MAKKSVVANWQGDEVIEATLQCGGHEVSILNYGCVVRDWRFQTAIDVRPIVLGFDKFESYPEHSPSFGIIAGRVANRTAEGRFLLAGNQIQLDRNNGNHHLHGGGHGLGKRLWKLELDSESNAVRLTYHSPAGEQGYPHVADLEVIYTLLPAGLHCSMTAAVSEPTPINLAQHNYYNLSPAYDSVSKFRHSCRDHSLQIAADKYLPVDDELIPTGTAEPVAGTIFDFRELASIEKTDPQLDGHDHNYVLRSDRDLSEPAARLRSPQQDVELSIVTEQPGIQMYSAKKLSPAVAGHDKQMYRAFDGICLEAQKFPNALNHPEWPSVMSEPDYPYRQDLMMALKQIPC